MYVPRKMLTINLKEARWMLVHQGVLSRKGKKFTHEVRDEEGSLLRSLAMCMMKKNDVAFLMINQEKNGAKTNFIVPEKTCQAFFMKIAASISDYDDATKEKDEEEDFEMDAKAEDEEEEEDGSDSE
jgi:hypothetical protein